MRWMTGLAGLAAGATMAWAALAAPPTHQVLEISVSPAAGALKGGRLLVFAEPLAAAEAKAKGGPLKSVDIRDIAEPGQVVAAVDIESAPAGAHLAIDLDGIAFPQGFSQMPPGEYAVQAVLDTTRRYNYAGRNSEHMESPVVRLRLPLDGAAPPITLSPKPPNSDPWASLSGVKDAAAVAALRAHTTEIAFQSPALSAFWGWPVTLRGWVVTPPDYDPKAKATWPTVYYTHGFGGSLASLLQPARAVYAAMDAHKAPPMIWVFLDESSPTGTHEFADSVNNGPWGKALTTELIPDLERHFRMDGRPNGRFLNGHSSGGWATLWLQTRYPKLFGGTWSTSPDPSDFHDFTGVDIYADHANAYVAPDGSKRPLVREGGKVVGTMEQFTRLEVVLGPVGGQEASFDWVFSPRGPDGRPLRMFDRATGVVDPGVAAYWRDHYDVAHLIAANWKTLKPDLDGKIHVAVGTADTFYLDGAAHRLQGVLDGLGAKSRFQFIPGRTHFDLYRIGDDDRGLLNVFAWEMYAIARPGSKLVASHPPAPSP